MFQFLLCCSHSSWGFSATLHPCRQAGRQTANSSLGLAPMERSGCTCFVSTKTSCFSTARKPSTLHKHEVAEWPTIVRQISTTNLSDLLRWTFHPGLWNAHIPQTLSFRVSDKSCDCQKLVSVSIGRTQLERSFLASAPPISPGGQKRSSVTQACSGQSVAQNKKPQMSENTQTLARKPAYRALVDSYVGLAAWRFRPNCRWKTSSLVLGFGRSSDDAGNRETGSTEGSWQRVSWPVKHFYCQWCSENYMSCRSNQGRLFPSGGWKLCFVLVLLGGRRKFGREGKWPGVTMWWSCLMFSTHCFVCSMLIHVTVTQLDHFRSGWEWKETLVKDDLCTVAPEARAVKSSRRQSSICGKQDSWLGRTF